MVQFIPRIDLVSCLQRPPPRLCRNPDLNPATPNPNSLGSNTNPRSPNLAANPTPDSKVLVGGERAVVQFIPRIDLVSGSGNPETAGTLTSSLTPTTVTPTSATPTLETLTSPLTLPLTLRCWLEARGRWCSSSLASTSSLSLGTPRLCRPGRGCAPLRGSSTPRR